MRFDSGNAILDKDTPYEVVVIGQGFVGLTLSVFIASKGLRVTGIENNPKTLSQLNSLKPHFYEKNLSDTLLNVIQKGNITFQDRIPSRNSNKKRIYIITVGTPLKNGQIYLGSLMTAIDEISKNLVDGDLIVSRSTVGIGMTRSLILEPLSEIADIFVASCPERTVEGNALHELETLVQVVGGDEQSSQIACAFFNSIGIQCLSGGSLEEVEYVKLVSNSFRDTLFAISNEFAITAERLGFSFSRIYKQLKYNYPRMNEFKLPGPVSGPCLSKDSTILDQSARMINSKGLELVKIGREINENLKMHIIDFVTDKKCNVTNVAILGAAFKGYPETDDTRDSFSIDLVREFSKLNSVQCIRQFDPTGSVLSGISSKLIEEISPLDEILQFSNFIVIANNHMFFRSDEFKTILSNGRDFGIYDFWDNLGDFQNKNISIFKLGEGEIN